MDELEKVEKLRERSNVSYEEAKQALNEANGDMLDAMIILENKGMINSGENNTHSTNYEEQTNIVNVQDTIDDQEEKNSRTICQKLKHLFRLVLDKCRVNRLVVERNNRTLISVPLWVFVVAAIAAFWTVGILLIVGLFFGCRYSVQGPDDLSIVNDVMDKAGDMADKVKEEFNKL